MFHACGNGCSPLSLPRRIAFSDRLALPGGPGPCGIGRGLTGPSTAKLYHSGDSTRNKLLKTHVQKQPNLPHFEGTELPSPHSSSIADRGDRSAHQRIPQSLRIKSYYFLPSINCASCSNEQPTDAPLPSTTRCRNTSRQSPSCGPRLHQPHNPKAAMMAARTLNNHTSSSINSNNKARCHQQDPMYLDSTATSSTTRPRK